MNRFFGIGRATATPELEQTNSGVAYTRFGIAIDRNYKDQAGEKITDFLNVIVWRGLAETCAKYIEKGRQIAVVGAGEMGGAIVCGLVAGGRVPAGNIRVSNPTRPKLEALERACPGVHITTSNKEAVRGAHLIDELREIEDDDLPF